MGTQRARPGGGARRSDRARLSYLRQDPGAHPAHRPLLSAAGRRPARPAARRRHRRQAAPLLALCPDRFGFGGRRRGGGAAAADVNDLNGWELGKALKLPLTGNAVVIEWLMSPIVYD